MALDEGRLPDVFLCLEEFHRRGRERTLVQHEQLCLRGFCAEVREHRVEAVVADRGAKRVELERDHDPSCTPRSSAPRANSGSPPRPRLPALVPKTCGPSGPNTCRLRNRATGRRCPRFLSPWADRTRASRPWTGTRAPRTRTGSERLFVADQVTYCPYWPGACRGRRAFGPSRPRAPCPSRSRSFLVRVGTLAPALALRIPLVLCLR